MIVVTDFNIYACRPDTPIRTVLERIDHTRYLFQVVVDEAGKLYGTITDGDIRRAMLHGIGLDAPARACMQTKPITGQIGKDVANFEKLRRTGSSRAFLPVVDMTGVLCEIHVADDSQGNNLGVALVMAGGAGTRLGEQTRNTPKPLLPVGGRPILDRVLESIETSGVDTILVSVHYLGEQIDEFIKERKCRTSIKVIYEPRQLGTAGAIGRIGSYAAAGPLLVINGDVLTRVDYAAMHEFHVRNSLDATVGVARHDIDIPFGVVRYGPDGLFAGIDEKPRLTNFIAAGVYYLSPSITALVSNDQPIDMPELLNLGRKIGLKIGVFPIHEYWTDVGRPDDLQRADDAHRLPNQSPK